MLESLYFITLTVKNDIFYIQSVFLLATKYSHLQMP